MIRHGCDHCGNWCELSDGAGGLIVVCPYCRCRMEVPEPTSIALPEAMRAGTPPSATPIHPIERASYQFATREGDPPPDFAHLPCSFTRDLQLKQDLSQEGLDASLWRSVGGAFFLVFVLSLIAEIPLGWWISGPGAALIVCTGLLTAMVYYLVAGLWDL